jgi:O-antigen ligase
VTRQPISPLGDIWSFPPRRDSGPRRAMVVLVILAVAGTCFLISAPEGVEAGHRPWGPRSVLHPITEMMTLFRQFPTRRGVEVKWLVQGVAAAAAVVVLAVGWWARREEEDAPAVPPRAAEPRERRELLAEMDPPTAAQIAWVLFGLWMLASASWAVWPAAAAGEGLRQIMLIAWAICLGRGLTRNGARNAAAGMMVVLIATAALGIWYHIERNPQERLKFPIGNPIFLAACLLPGITLAGSMLIGTLAQARRARAGAGKEERKKGVPPPLSPPSVRTALAAAGLVGSLGVLLWALKLTDSRGPMLGLAAGVVMTAVLAARGRLRLLLLVAAVLGVLAASVWFRSQMDVQERGRGATTQLRLYAWRYAFELFLTRPDIGKGQGSYVLLAQQMSRADAEQDPAPFPGLILGHAHNEWLELLADLGAAGFALCATALGLTLWCAVAALRRVTEIRDRWCLLGLMAALVAIIVEESAGVALRMPGLPLIFFTTIGLIWAVAGSGSREWKGRLATETHTAGVEDRDRQSRLPVRGTQTGDREGAEPLRLDPLPYGQGPVTAIRSPQSVLRYVLLVAGLLAGGAILTAAVRDWQGALADTAVGQSIDRQEWEEALAKAAVAGRYRLSIEDFVSAGDQATRAAHAAAIHQVRQLQDTAERAAQPQKPAELGRQPGIDPLQITHLAREDAIRFDRYFSACLAEADTLLRRMPAYPHVAGLVADVWLARQALEAAEQQLGLRPEAGSYIDEARQWMLLEYMRDRLDAENAVRLFQLSGHRPLAERLNLLRLPLRRGPIHPFVEPALFRLMQEPRFEPLINQLLSQAELALAAPVEEWPDRYAPETLRLAALAHRLQGNVGNSAAMAIEAARLLERIQDRFPRALAYARMDRARYLLLADPVHAERAVESASEAIAGAPWLAGDERVGFLRDLALYHLAAGNEEAARTTFRASGEPEMPAEMVEHNIGYAYGELYQAFMRQEPGRRPPAWDQWLERSLQLVPDWPTGQLLAARRALELGQSMSAVAHLKNAQQYLDAEQMQGMVESLLAEFPDDQLLRAYASELRTEN